MDQLKSNNKQTVAAPARKFTLEFWVGLFMFVCVLCIGWLSIGLGGLDLFSSDSYEIYAEFDNISGLKNGVFVTFAETFLR